MKYRSSTYTVTLPTPVGYTGKAFSVWSVATASITFSTPSGNILTASGSSSTTYSLAANSTVELIADGTNWVVAFASTSGVTTTSGTSFPGSSTAGQGFYLTAATSTYGPGLYIYSGSAWQWASYTPTFGTALVSGTFSGQQIYLTASYTAPASGNPTGTTASTVYPIGLYTYDLANTTWYAALPISQTPYDVSGYVPGMPSNGAELMLFLTPRGFTIPANFAGSYAQSNVAATASTVYTIYQNTTAVATITFAASGTTGTFSTQAAITFTPGQIISVVAPSTVDATHAQIMWTFLTNLTQIG